MKGAAQVVRYGSLSTWVDPRHLEPSAIAEHRRRFAAQPHQPLILDDFLHPGLADNVAQFLEHQACFAAQHALYPGDIVDDDAWRDAPPEARFSRDEALVGTAPEHRLSPGVIAFLRLRTSLRHANFVRLLGELSGLPVSRAEPDEVGNVKRMGRGDFILPHDDVVDGRVLGLILHLTRDWRADWGGELILATEDGVPTAVSTAWNRAVLFPARTGSTHAVSEIAVAAGAHHRLTIGSWYG